MQPAQYKKDWTIIWFPAKSSGKKVLTHLTQGNSSFMTPHSGINHNFTGPCQSCQAEQLLALLFQGHENSHGLSSLPCSRSHLLCLHLLHIAPSESTSNSKVDSGRWHGKELVYPAETSCSKLRCSCVAGLSAKLDSCPSLAPNWLLVAEGGKRISTDPTLSKITRPSSTQRPQKNRPRSLPCTRWAIKLLRENDCL